jgi:hypothetical protein
MYLSGTLKRDVLPAIHRCHPFEQVCKGLSAHGQMCVIAAVNTLVQQSNPNELCDILKRLVQWITMV